MEKYTKNATITMKVVKDREDLKHFFLLKISNTHKSKEYKSSCTITQQSQP